MSRYVMWFDFALMFLGVILGIFVLVVVVLLYVVVPVYLLYLSAKGAGKVAARTASAVREYGAKKREEREDLKSDARSLLHPSSAPEPAGETLLRAAWQPMETDPQTLLRPEETAEL